jgi:hypothetical protein
MLRSGRKLTSLPRKIDEKKSSVIMKMIDNIILKKQESRGLTTFRWYLARLRKAT